MPRKLRPGVPGLDPGKDGATVIILLGGGIKKRQSRDVLAARECWDDYKERKTREKYQCH